MEFGWSLPKRKHLLDELSKVRQEKKYPLKFQGQMRQFDVLRVPIEMPKYRLANGRTQAAQEEFLSKHPEYPSDFFDRDLENEEAIAIQHKLLKVELKGTNADLEVFFKSNIQEEPIILTHQGFVVNGNRRLCAMREVFHSDKTAFQRYRHVDVIVLPPCDERDIDELEAQLQIKKDIKADYSWISTACMLRKKRNMYGMGDDELAKMYSMKPEDVKELLDKLAHVDAYLTSRNKAKMYDEVTKAEYAFEQLRKCRNKIKDVAKKEIFTSVTYCIIDNPPKGRGRVYDIIPDIHEYLPKVIEKLQEEFDVSSDEDDDLDILRGIADESAELESLALLLNDPTLQEGVLEVVKDVVDSERAKDKDTKNRNFVINQVQKANTMLSEAILAFESSTNIKGMDEQLMGIEASVSRLRELLSKYAKN